MSICSGRARRPIASISLASAAPLSFRRRPSATSAPACAQASAQARPSPRAEAVTSTTWPLEIKARIVHRIPPVIGPIAEFERGALRLAQPSALRALMCRAAACGSAG